MPDNYLYVEPDHPGVLLNEEFLQPLGISQNKLAIAAGVPRSRVNQIVKGNRSITAETSIRLGRALGLSDFYFLRVQFEYDRLKALKVSRDIKDVAPIVKPAA